NANLNKNVKKHFLRVPAAPTILKRRFLEEYLSAKLFEVYMMRSEGLDAETEAQFCGALEAMLPQYDVVIVADYGHGLMTQRAVDLVCEKSKFLAVNTQTNAGNRGFNTISKYPRADFVSLGEPEVRLDSRDVSGDLEKLALSQAKKI